MVGSRVVHEVKLVKGFLWCSFVKARDGGCLADSNLQLKEKKMDRHLLPMKNQLHQVKT